MTRFHLLHAHTRWHPAHIWIRLACFWLLLAGLGQCTMTVPPATPETATGIPAGAEAAHVVRVIAGDTIAVSLDGAEYRVCYILIDAPEQEEPYYNEAAKLNQLLLGNRPVHLLRDVSDTDQHGCLLRYVYTEDGVLVNAEIVREGMAALAVVPPDTRFRSTIAAAEEEARTHGYGIWHEPDR